MHKQDAVQQLRHLLLVHELDVLYSLLQYMMMFLMLQLKVGLEVDRMHIKRSKIKEYEHPRAFQLGYADETCPRRSTSCSNQTLPHANSMLMMVIVWGHE